MSPAWNELLHSAHAWYMQPEQIPPTALSQLFLDRAESAHLRKLTKKHLQHNYLAARALCRAALSHYTNVPRADWRFKPTRFGKPRIAAPRGFSSLKFNLTHTDGLLICLITRATDVGVDAEETSRRVNIEEVSRHFFSQSEQAELARLPLKQRTSRFFEIWVLKEAYLKGRGRGLTISPERVSINFISDGNPAPIRTWQLALHHPTPNHVAATAIHANKPIPIAWQNAARLFKT